MIITQSYIRPQQNALKATVFVNHYLKYFADMIKKIQSDFILHLNDINEYIIIIVQEYFVEIPRQILEYFISQYTDNTVI